MNFKLSKPIYLKNFILTSLAKPLVDSKINFDYKIKYVVTDTRKYKGKGGIFFAIKGKTFDGHNFITQIINKVDYVVISDKDAIINSYKKKFLIVKDTTVALDRLASLYRSLFSNVKLISVVGSNGKTTTKELIKFILEKKYNTVATYLNQNNLFGVAYTLFNLNSKTEYCVVELGISAAGEMDILGSTVKPNTVVITNIGKEHLEFFGSVDKVFAEETKIVQYIPHDGLLVINRDDNYLKTLGWTGTKKYYGIFTNNDNLDVYPQGLSFKDTYTEITIILKDELGLKLKMPKIKTKLLGRHNVYNILAAITTTFFSGMTDSETIVESISEFEPLAMRGAKFIVNNNIILDESYNANPDSMFYSITEFMNIFVKKQKVLVLGDMLELGDKSKQEHENLKNIIDFNKIKFLYLIGDKMKYLLETLDEDQREKTKYFVELNELINELSKILKQYNNLAILFKSSHAVGLHYVVEEVRKLMDK
ncbi:MAG: UDP-N-acetylmuramoyl-tripeptide--D-alanyl-D-alanine ligase [Endomicrobia bacterium]|nr:UDP-N-acetylmuramoyl-tripeptide--D-alanyl-D-alanine ligase [Endomicrobiia bacterium]MDW8055881.1 UDP-N-acetylmuramoyl-tripeptide--D-alanyl-D-alanine ligase [Elusimicrobiota bacterium]